MRIINLDRILIDTGARRARDGNVCKYFKALTQLMIAYLTCLRLLYKASAEVFCLTIPHCVPLWFFSSTTCVKTERKGKASVYFYCRMRCQGYSTVTVGLKERRAKT